MGNFISGIIGMILGFFLKILHGRIQESSVEKKAKSALLTEIKANFYPLRDARSYARERIISIDKDLKIQTKDQRYKIKSPVVIHDYKFTRIAFESNINNLSSFGEELSLKIHHFYTTLRTLEQAAGSALRQFELQQEIMKKNPELRDVKIMDEENIGSLFQRIVDDYHLFENQAYRQGEELINLLEKEK